jgi:hypothetical protein
MREVIEHWAATLAPFVASTAQDRPDWPPIFPVGADKEKS